MKKKDWILAMALVFLLTGCGGKNASADTAASTSESTSVSDVYYDGAGMNQLYGTETEEAASEEAGEMQATGQKLIRNMSMTLETREFDALLADINAKVTEYGGYIENSQVSGVSYRSSAGYRYAWLTLRIPAERLNEFMDTVGELGNVTSQSESVQDVTLEYVDVESHKEALETEQDRLLELMSQAETMEDILAIEERLSEIRYELGSYESRLRTYDNQVDYSTLTLDINEVERESSSDKNLGFFGEIQVKLSDNIYAIGRGIRSFAVWLISSLPYLILCVIVLWLAVRTVQKIFFHKSFFRRKRKDKTDEKSEE